MPMDTISFTETLKDCADKCGVLLGDGTVALSHAGFLVRSLNERMRKAWRYYAWPVTKLVEERAFRDLFELGLMYWLGAEVYDPETRGYYRAVADGFAGRPVADAAYWERMDGDGPDGRDGRGMELRYVALRQAGRTPIGEVFEATGSNPLVKGESRGIRFTLTSKGVQFEAWAPKTVWLQFREPAPQFTLTGWTAGVYPAGTLKLGDDGECYLAVASETDAVPGSDEGQWHLQAVPVFLHDYLVAAVYGDWLKDDGQTDKAVEQQAEAVDLLDDEVAQITKQQRQTQRYRVRVR